MGRGKGELSTTSTSIDGLGQSATGVRRRRGGG